MNTIGLVTEGKTDQVVIQHLLDCYAQSQGIQGAWNYRRLQPVPPDQTLGKGSRGWGGVRQWCQDHPSGSHPRRLFANNRDRNDCDKIIIHLDADLLDKDPGNTSFQLPNTPTPSPASTPTERGAFMRGLLCSWLSCDPNNPDPRHILAPAVEATETWLVAGLCDDEEPECNRAVMERLAECAQTVEKSEINYQRLAQQAGQEIDRIANRCPHFKQLADAVFA